LFLSSARAAKVDTLALITLIFPHHVLIFNTKMQ